MLPALLIAAVYSPASGRRVVFGQVCISCLPLIYGKFGAKKRHHYHDIEVDTGQIPGNMDGTGETLSGRSDVAIHALSGGRRRAATGVSWSRLSS